MGILFLRKANGIISGESPLTSANPSTSSSAMNLDLTYWNNLKIKYQATHFTDDSRILNLILAKAELVLSLNDFEKQWLKSKNLLETLQMIEHLQQEKAKLATKLQHEFIELSSKYKAVCSSSWRENSLYLICLKLDYEEPLTEGEISWLQRQPRKEIQRLAILSQKVNEFSKLKSKYKINQRPELSLESCLFSILQNLDNEESLNDKDIDYLKKHQFDYALSIFEKQKANKEAKFAELREKYQVIDYPETSIENPLYSILQKVDLQILPDDSEIQ